ncbi:MAG: FG-GAP-like repeat-containing protein [Acidobacteriota bacterium]|nr:FG-GAP-like repeat-containing protein [Acidobacteriota bacterium]
MTSRRTFLGAAAALGFYTPRAHAATPFPVRMRTAAPYASMLKFAMPGGDEFPAEKSAMEWEAALTRKLLAGTLPVTPERVEYRGASADVSLAHFGSQGEPWLSALGEITAARFFVLPEDKVRYEISSRFRGKPHYRTGQALLRIADGQPRQLVLDQETLTTADRLWFTDVSSHMFRDCPSFREQLCKGIPYWRARLDPATGIDIYGSNGISAADLDNDGLDEIYVCQPGGLPNRLYKNMEGGRFEDISQSSGLDLLDDTSGALFLDWRNIGVQDAVVLRGSGPLLFLNDGKNRFHLRPDAFRFAEPAKGSFTGMAAADYDRDGKLDLYLCTYSFFQSEAQYRYPAPYHDARNGPPNFLFRNTLNADGTGHFEDVTQAAGLDQNNTQFSFAPAWCDTTGGGWPDLYVANDFGRNNFYRNNRGRFTDQAKEAGVEDLGPGMSASWFDYDGDGRPDLYVSNMWSAAGRRLVHQKNFAPAREFPDAYRRHTKGNSLYRNHGDGRFSDTGEQQNVEMGRWAWSSGGFDFDGDGRPEILTTCGMLTNVSPQDLMSFFWRQVVAHSPHLQKSEPAYENGWNAINQLIREDYSWNGNEPNVFYGRRGGQYYDFSGVSGIDTAEDGRAFAVTDFDGDGIPDLLIKNRLGPQVRAFQNQQGARAQWIAFDLIGTKSNRDAIGARVEVDGKVQSLQAGSGYLSQHSKRLHFGLGSATQAERVRIQWPSGLESALGPLKAGFRYRISEGLPEPERIPFATKSILESGGAPETDNVPRLHTTWFSEPVPLPERQPGPGLLTLDEHSLGSNGDRTAWYALFRRYLFDYRVELSLPLHLLIDAESRACKIYAEQPTKAQVAEDVKTLASFNAEREALPFNGRYVSQPHRDQFKLGAAFYWAGYPDQALPYLVESLKRNPDNARVLLALGKIHLELGRPAEAKIHLMRAAALNPSSAEAWNELGGVAAAQNDDRGAMALYRKALTCDPHFTYALLNAAQTAEKLNERPEAEALFRRVLAADPDSADAGIGLGLLLANAERYAEAKNLFLKTIELHRNNPSAINNLGVLYMKMGQANDAIATLRYGTERIPDSELLAMNLARVYVQSGEPEKGRAVLLRFLESSPRSEAARKALRELENR